jgi:transposase-like protein
LRDLPIIIRASTATLLRVVDMKKRRHTRAEIAAKLSQAAAMSAQGRLHSDIAKALGISAMTYHRWRKAREPSSLVVGSQHSADLKTSPIGQTTRISELQVENSRLRRLVTDLLLEKMNLEEGIHDRVSLPRSRRPNL